MEFLIRKQRPILKLFLLKKQTKIYHTFILTMERKISFKRKYLPSYKIMKQINIKKHFYLIKVLLFSFLKCRGENIFVIWNFLKRKKIPLIKNQYLYTFESFKFQYCYVILPFFSDLLFSTFTIFCLGNVLFYI